ncbi:hypothetical protein HJC23_001690 [Cyclotella cryptica]|uniref:Uncharacterized protein n=1 Tax=Cyclotella cryptica TaxID=29204 RepID=A0ABD3QK77_9STRA
MSAGKIVNSGLKSPDGWCCTQFEDTDDGEGSWGDCEAAWE